MDRICRLFAVVFLTISIVIVSVVLSYYLPNGRANASTASDSSTTSLVERGKKLATLGVCAACHTPPAVPETSPLPSDISQIQNERQLRADPDWVSYLDSEKQMAGGVPFILRFSANQSGVVFTRNITPDPETGLGNWSEDEIVEVIKTGKRKDGTALFLFPPHTFYKNLAMEDARALAAYLKSLPPVYNPIPERSVPFPVEPVSNTSELERAPSGRNRERAEYLMSSLVGCKECHSYHGKDGQLVEFAGGDTADPFQGVFRLGPDLPLRAEEKGFAAFPYPGYAVLYGGNLTRFGVGGDLNNVPASKIVRALRQGLSTQPDKYGRPQPLSYVMMWHFYKDMTNDDAYALADYLKSLQYIPHEIEPRLNYYGEDWEAAFEKVFGEKPSENDKAIFGKSSSAQ
jgi:hypothetical protein